jgi:nicotinate-nucleotide pyrophosphorylase (carboxylating)
LTSRSGKGYNPSTMEKYIAVFLAEDIGEGDITTNSIVPDTHVSEAVIVAKEDCVIAGQAYACMVFEALDPNVSYEIVIKDGQIASKGDVVSQIKAKTRAILSGERVALNIFQRLSGIATATSRFVRATEGRHTRILDTRKTTPGMRTMEKYAVTMGGGMNHRFGLSDMALIKENHIAIAGSITKAVEAVRQHCSVRGTSEASIEGEARTALLVEGATLAPLIGEASIEGEARTALLVEVEVKDIEELMEAVETKVDRIMLDNWKDEDVISAVEYVRRRIPLEVSGNMTVERAGALAATGIDFISVGSITHSLKSADLSLLIV